MSYLQNILSMKCPIYEMFFYEMTQQRNYAYNPFKQLQGCSQPNQRSGGQRHEKIFVGTSGEVYQQGEFIYQGVFIFFS